MDEIFKKAGGLLKSFKDGLNGISSVDLSDVITDIEECNIYSRNFPSEKECEQTILKHLRAKSGYNNVHQQYSVGGNLALKIDLDIDERIGVEIKLADQLIDNASNAQRLLGQVLYYSKRKYQYNVIVLVIGASKLQNDPLIKELASLIENDLNLTFLYKSFK
jgi:hypothetical protein